MYINSINFGSNKTNTVNYTQKTNLTPTAKKHILEPKKEETNNSKYIIGATLLLSIAGLFIAGVRGKLGKNIQKLLKGEDISQNITQKTNKLNDDADNIIEQLNKQFEAEELQKELQLKNKIKESNARNQKWVEEQHKLKEQEYSDWWNKALDEQEAKAAKEAQAVKDAQAAKAAQEAKIAAEKAANEFQIDLNAPVTINHDLFSGNYPNPTYLAKTIKQEPETAKVLKELENTTFDTKDLKLIKDHYDKNNPYDLWLRYAIVANNTAKQKGTGAIINEIPNMFKGIEQKELLQKLDNLPTLLESKKINKFKIGNNQYTAEIIGGGCISDVYKITKDATGEQVCMKFARQPYLTGRGQGIFDEVAITQEALKAGVVDVPKLYMANPLGRYATLDSGCITNNGSWQMTELIKPDRKVPENGLKLLDWLKSKGLFHGDYNQGATVGNTFVDLGGIIDADSTFTKFSDLDALLKAYQNGETTTDIIKNYCQV